MRAARYLVLAALLAVSGTASAVEGDFYWGLAYMHGNYDFDSGATYHPEGAVAKLGYDLIGQRIAFEVHLASSRDDRKNIGGIDTRLSLTYLTAAFLRYNIVARDNFRLYAMGGYGRAKVHYEVTGVGTKNDTSSGAAYGVGMELYGNEHGAINIDYLRYVKDADISGAKFQINSVNIGYVHHF